MGGVGVQSFAVAIALRPDHARLQSVPSIMEQVVSLAKCSEVGYICTFNLSFKHPICDQPSWQKMRERQITWIG